MPRIAGISGPYWFFFYSFDCGEPMHVHVRRDRAHAKFWIAPTELVWNRGFSHRDLNTIERIINEHAVVIAEAWDEHCGSD